MSRERRVKWVAATAGLMVLLGLNYFLRHTLERADQYLYPFLPYFYPDATRDLFTSASWWRLLMPVPEFTGSWTTTTLILTHAVERQIGTANAWYLFNAILIVSSFATSWLVFRSLIFSFTLAICMGFGTQLVHTYSAAGGVGFYLLFAYYQVLLLSACRVVSGEQPWFWRGVFVLALLVTSIAYKGWLDFLVFGWVACLFAGLMLWRMGERARLVRLASMAVATTVWGAIYIAIKVVYGYGQSPGKESDVVFNYPVLMPAVEDVIVNVFTHAYLVFTNFLPPMLVSSSSLYQIGPEELVRQQFDYSAPFQYLVVMNHVFLWRYYAGAALVVFAIFTWKTLRDAYRRPSWAGLALGVILLMTGIGGPTHDFIKFRPMNSMPVLSYHVLVGVLGMSLLIAFALMTAEARIRSRVLVAALIAGTWATIFYGALVRPEFLSHQAAQVGLGEGLYPNPRATLSALLNRPYQPKPGASLYQLAKSEHRPAATPVAGGPTAVAPGGFGLPLPRLPQTAPDLEAWMAFTDVAVDATADGYQVTGNAAGGYQLVSPPISVPVGHRLLLRVDGEIMQGRACVGVLDRQQATWLFLSDGSQPEVSVDTGDNDAVHVVFTDCRLRADTPDASFTVRSVTYAVLRSAEDAGR